MAIACSCTVAELDTDIVGRDHTTSLVVITPCVSSHEGGLGDDGAIDEFKRRRPPPPLHPIASTDVAMALFAPFNIGSKEKGVEARGDGR